VNAWLGCAGYSPDFENVYAGECTWCSLHSELYT
jgi:hypothetical protein